MKVESFHLLADHWTWKHYSIFIELCLCVAFGIPIITWSVVSLVRDWDKVHIVKRSRYFILWMIIHAFIVQFSLVNTFAFSCLFYSIQHHTIIIILTVCPLLSNPDQWEGTGLGSVRLC